MTESEYNRITVDYVKETIRWQGLEIGQKIYSSNGFDWFEHEVIAIDVPNRKVTCIDHSLWNKPIVVLSTFWFREEIH